jgi:hypothetical protein
MGQKRGSLADAAVDIAPNLPGEHEKNARKWRNSLLSSLFRPLME